jgi:hypothetical protein
MASQPSPTKTSSLSSWSPSLQEALELDVSVMEALLRRNRCSHQRCKYYQRLAMALRAIQKESFLSTIEDSLQSFRDDLIAERQRRSMQKIRRDDDFWVLSGTNQQAAAPDTPVAVLSKLHNRLCTFAARVNEYFCQSISRLEYASTMLFVEIARGFFLPFCTVAVASVARVRALLRRLCLSLTNSIIEVADDIKKNLSTLENSKNVHLGPLWTPAQVTTFQTQGLWLQPSLDSDSTSTKASSAYDRREQQCRATWKALGTPTCKRRQANVGQASLDQEGMGSTENDDDNDNDRTDSSAEPIPSSRLEVDVLAADTNHDMGEAVEEGAESTLALDRSDVAASSASIDIDQNLSLVQELQMEKKRKKSKEKDNKRATEKSTKKKKKAKKSKQADFFDDLFT